MSVVGGICFLTIGFANEHFTHKMPLWKKLLISTVIITVLEFIAGLILNKGLGLNIWDYSNIRFNYMGQICLKYSMFWFFLSLPAIVFYDFILYRLFGEKKPNYKFIKMK